jgi:hypothetical protein
MRRYSSIAVLVAFALLFNSISAFAQAPAPPAASPAAPPETIAGEFVRRLPIGTSVEVRLDDGERVKGTLMAIEESNALIKERTRVPEAPRTVALGRIVDADVMRGNSLGKGIAIGVAIGVGSTFAFAAVMAALLGD